MYQNTWHKNIKMGITRKRLVLRPINVLQTNRNEHFTSIESIVGTLEILITFKYIYLSRYLIFYVYRSNGRVRASEIKYF